MKKYIVSCVLLLACGLLLGAAPSPPGGGVGASKTSFEQSSPFAHNFACSSVRQWIPFNPINFSVSSDGDVTSTVKSLGSGTVTFANINSSSVAGFTFDSDNSDTISVPWIIPGDIDLSQPIYLKVLFSESSTTAGSVGFTTQYLAITTGTTALAAQSTTTGVTDGDEIATSTTANVLQWTNATTIAASTFSSLTPGQDIVVFELTSQFTTVSDMTMYGLQIIYSRKYIGCGEGM